MPTLRFRSSLAILLTSATLALLAGCRSRDNCYKTYQDDPDSPTGRALNPDDEKPKVEPAPTRPTAETLPPPMNPNNVPR
jgi:hypothetical protein